MGQLSEKTVNHGDLAAFYDQHMKDVVMPNANKGIKNEAVCQTAAETAAKTIIAPEGFSLANGVTIIVGFANAIGVANATFAIGTAVNSTADDYSEKNPATEGWCVLSGGTFVLTEDTEPQNGTTYYTVSAAKPINYRGVALGANMVKAGSQIILRYDGTSFNIIGNLDTDTVTDITFDSNTNTLKKTVGDQQSDIVKIVNSGFSVVQDDGNGIDEFSAIGGASITEDDTNGIDEYDF